MVDFDQLAATRTTLLDLRRELNEAREGRSILERKREVLLRELWGLLQQAKQTEQDVRACFSRAYAAQKEARLLMGMEAMRFAGLAPAAETDCSVDLRSIMGVALPLVSMNITPLPMSYSPAGISAAFDELRIKWIEAGRTLGPWIETIGSIWRVAEELERTQRRVNVLDHVLIPKYQSAIGRIQAALEEQERESFLRTKRMKERKR